jgi:hypothetical protein
MRHKPGKLTIARVRAKRAKAARARKRQRDPFNGKVRPLMKQANKLFEDFTGDKLARGKRVKAPVIPPVLINMGKIDGVMYTTVRDGKTERYIHEFKSKARPTFAVSPDGKQLFMLGGAYNFTERGIVDKR